ncbi:MAG TPA: GNAT family N-acetyltransferase [Ktedonobacter sp.]|nr:GNAT family N-acetyltransferase [Ktedonobacter sp.]
MQLVTERLLLREFVEGDWQPVLAYQSDPLYLRYNPWSYRTAEDVRGFVHRFMLWSEEQPRRKYQFAIVLRSNGMLIGNGGIRMKTANAWEADLGYELNSQYWGYGYATEAAKALLAFGFQDLKLHRIWAHCIFENTASAHVLEKIGMRREGHLRENEWMKNRWWDTLQYAILDHEWFAYHTH